MKTPIRILVLAVVLAAAPLAAQESSEGKLASVLQALGLPRATQEARVLGVPEPDIRAVLDAAREKRLPAGDVAEVIEGGNQAIREHGPIDNFGAFVQARLDEGLRGRDLAAAIRAEHVARGKGKGHAKGASGQAEVAGPRGAASAGRPGGVGQAASTGGRPETAGKPASAGQARGPGQSGARGRSDSPDKPDSTDRPGAAKAAKKGGPR